MWDDQDFALHTGYHVPGFIDFQSIEQFEPAIRQLARRAEQKVTAVQQTHGSIRDTADILAAAEEALLAQGGGVGWPHYHAAIACGLAGGTEAALWMFDRVLTVTSDGGGAPDIRCKSAALARLLRKDPSHS